MPISFPNTYTGLKAFRPSAFSSRTPFPIAEVDPVILDVVFEWDGIEHSIIDLLTERPILKYPRNAVQAVAYIKSALGVSQSDVLKAVGIPPRTFFGWKKLLSNPRQSSLGSLWPMVKTISGLVQVQPNLKAWFNTTDGARDKFLAGDLDGLVLRELDYRLATREIIQPFTPDFEDFDLEVRDDEIFKPISPFRSFENRTKPASTRQSDDEG